MNSVLKNSILFSIVFAVSTLAAHAELTEKTVTYTINGATFESTIVFDKTAKSQPGILMVPNWMGPTEASLKKAKDIADEGYVVMMVDMYGTDVRPANAEEAGKAAGFVRGDREIMRQRANTALKEFRATRGIPLNKSDIAAIGFCFGGGTVLELGRSGAKVDAIVSFHGDLKSPTLIKDAGETRAKVLVLHGANDPYVPQEHVQEWISAMLATDVDWQLVQFSNTVHSFTDPNAKAAGAAEFYQLSNDRAFEMMDELFEELWDDDYD